MSAQIRSINVLPARGVILVIFEDDSHALTPITGYDATKNPSYKINGGAAVPLSLHLASALDPFLLWPCCTPPFVAVVDDTDAGCVIVPTPAIPPATGPIQQFTGWDAHLLRGRGGVYWMDTTTVATYTSPTMPLGTYHVSISLTDDNTRSSDVVYTIKDGGTTRATIHVDQTVINPPWNRLWDGVRFTEIAPAVTCTSGVLTVTVQSAVDLVTTVTDAVRFELNEAELDAFAADDVVTFSADAGWATTSAGVLPAAVDVPVTILTDAEHFGFDPAAPRTMGLGYNPPLPNAAYPSRFFADRLRSAVYNWSVSGGVTLDANGYPTGITTGQHATTQFLDSFGNGLDGGNFECAKSGTYRVELDHGTAATVAINGVSSYITIDGPHSLPDNTATGQKVVGFDVTFPVYDGNHADTMQYSGTLSLTISNDDVSATDKTHIHVYGPEVPANYSDLFHPDFYSRLQGKGFATLRSVTILAMNGNPVVAYSDYLPESYYSTQNKFRRYGSVISVEPADTSGNTDHVNDFFRFRHTYYKAVKVKTDGPHGLVNGSPVFFSDMSINPIPDGGGGAGVDLQNDFGYVAGVVDDTTFIVAGHSDTTVGDHGQTVIDTLPPGVVTLTGSVYQKFEGIHPRTFLKGCAAVGIPPWLQVPLLANDACATQLGTDAAELVPAGHKIRVELSNEPWDGALGFTQTDSAALLARVASVAGLPVQPDLPSEWVAYRSGQVWPLFEAAWVAGGRDVNDVIRVVNVQRSDTDPVRQSVGCAARQTPPIVFHELSFDTYLVNDSYAHPVNGADPDTAAAIDALRVTDLIDVFPIFLRYGGFDGQVAYLANLLATTPGYEGVKLTSYEGSTQNLCYYGTMFQGANQWARSHAATRHPRAYLPELGTNAYLQSLGITQRCYFEFDGVSKFETDAWYRYLRGGQLPGYGDGSPGTFGGIVGGTNDNRVNPWDLSKVDSVTAAADLFWASGLTATGYTISVASTGIAGVGMTVTVTYDGPVTLTQTLTPTDGSFSPANTIAFTAEAGPKSVTFTPLSAGTATITGTNDGGFANPSAKSIAVSGGGSAFRAYFRATPTPVGSGVY